MASQRKPSEAQLNAAANEEHQRCCCGGRLSLAIAVFPSMKDAEALNEELGHWNSVGYQGRRGNRPRGGEL